MEKYRFFFKMLENRGANPHQLGYCLQLVLASTTSRSPLGGPSLNRRASILRRQWGDRLLNQLEKNRVLNCVVAACSEARPSAG
jgi:hypothetical protein